MTTLFIIPQLWDVVTISRYFNHSFWNYKWGWNWVFLIIGIIFVIGTPSLINNEYSSEHGIAIFLAFIQSICLFFIISNIFNIIFEWNGCFLICVIIGILLIINIAILGQEDNYGKPLTILLVLSVLTTLFIIPQLWNSTINKGKFKTVQCINYKAISKVSQNEDKIVSQNTQIAKTNDENKIVNQNSQNAKTSDENKNISQNTQVQYKEPTKFTDRYFNYNCWNYKWGWNWVFLIIGIIFVIGTPLLMNNNEYGGAIFLAFIQSICLFFIISNIFNILFNWQGWTVWGILIAILLIINISIWANEYNCGSPLGILWMLSILTTLFIIPQIWNTTINKDKYQTVQYINYKEISKIYQNENNTVSSTNTKKIENQTVQTSKNSTNTKKLTDENLEQYIEVSLNEETLKQIGYDNNSEFLRYTRYIYIPDTYEYGEKKYKITEIGDNIFTGYKSLQEISIPESVKRIGNNAFNDCTSLDTIIIPKSVTSIGDSAFNNCTSLTILQIPDDVIHIGNNAFGGVKHILYYGTASGSPWGAENVNGIEVVSK